MRETAMPSDHQELVVREHVAEDVDVREHCTEHGGPGRDAALVHVEGRKDVVAVEHGFADQGAGDSVSDRVHRLFVRFAKSRKG